MCPGVYLFKDSRSRVIYVGKASRLRNRVTSYFGSPNRFSPKVVRLVEHICDFEFFVTSTEEEALVLELNLIKKLRPTYNISLKDDKSFPYLKIDMADGYPRILVTRRLMQDRGRYFGPFASAASVRMILGLIKRMFPFRSCTRPIDGKILRPCLDYHIKRCLAPCVGAVTKEEYGQMVRRITLFLEGRLEEVLIDMRLRMQSAAEELNFEKAAALRDQIQAVEQVIQEQRMATTVKGDQDVIAFARAGDLTTVDVFFIRNGKLIGKECFTLEGTRDEQPPQIMAVFVKQFYGSAANVPSVVLLQHPAEDMSTIQTWLTHRRGSKTRLIVPRRGARKTLIDTVAENARHEQEQRRIKDVGASTDLSSALKEISRAMGLPEPCRRIECYDISNISGSNAVGSMVVFEDGKPARNHYRRFRIRTVSGSDDYSMMREMLERRFRRHNDSAKNGMWAVTPDLVLVDGGKGHLAVAAEVVGNSDVKGVFLASIAKEHEEVFVQNRSLPLDLCCDSPGLRLLQRIRDEAHRFAISYHRDVRSRESKTSLLDAIPGIGPKRRKALLKRFGSVNGISAASIEEIAGVPGMNRATTEKVRQYLQNLAV